MSKGICKFLITSTIFVICSLVFYFSFYLDYLFTPLCLFCGVAFVIIGVPYMACKEYKSRRESIKRSRAKLLQITAQNSKLIKEER